MSIRAPPSPDPGLLRAAASGLGMGTADAVPGVSGGTIALILGIYEQLIDALHSCLRWLRRPWDGHLLSAFCRRLPFLTALGVGIVIAYLLATRLLVGNYELPADLDATGASAHLAAHPPAGLLMRPGSAPVVFGFFFGLVLWSIRVPWLARRSRAATDWWLAIAGAVAAGGVTLLPSLGVAPAPPLLIIGGALAISAMLLPGISGSLVLLVLGLYQPIAGAVHGGDLITVAWALLGMLVGAALFIPLLRLLLERHHDRTMAALSGLMAGSLVALWPWKAHYLPDVIPLLGAMHPRPPQGAWWWPVCAAVVGCLLIAMCERWSRNQNAA